MTNFEFWKNELEELARGRRVNVAIVKGKPRACVGLPCDECDRLEDCSGSSLVRWLLSEQAEKPKLTKKERLFCELAETGWIARDKNGDLYLYGEKPERKPDFFHTGCPYFAIDKNASSPYFASFSFIKWEDEEPWSVEDLLKLEVE